jgi:hypothetical protein
MTFPTSSRPDDDLPRPDPVPGREPADPWAEDEARRRGEEGWVSEGGGLGPIPARTWSRGGTRVTVGGCCLPLPIGCLTTLVAGAAVAVSMARRAAR